MKTSRKSRRRDPVYRFKLFALPSYLRSFPPHCGDALPVWLQPTRNTQAVFPGFWLQRLLASHQHLLEGLHDEDLLLPDLHENQKLGRDHSARIQYAASFHFYLASAFLPVVLAAREDSRFSTVDAVYWGVLGVLVAINSVWETKRGKKKPSLQRVIASGM